MKIMVKKLICIILLYASWHSTCLSSGGDSIATYIILEVLYSKTKTLIKTETGKQDRQSGYFEEARIENSKDGESIIVIRSGQPKLVINNEADALNYFGKAGYRLISLYPISRFDYTGARYVLEKLYLKPE